ADDGTYLIFDLAQTSKQFPPHDSGTGLERATGWPPTGPRRAGMARATHRGTGRRPYVRARPAPWPVRCNRSVVRGEAEIPNYAASKTRFTFDHRALRQRNWPFVIQVASTDHARRDYLHVVPRRDGGNEFWPPQN